MKNLNKEKWKEFIFDDVFSLSRGKRFVKSDQASGNVAYTSSTKQNNGVDNYITPPDFMTIYQNALTLNNSGSVGYCFYHSYKFVASDHCTVIQIKSDVYDLNSHIALFLKPVIESMKNKYNFAREINNDRLKRGKVLLPADKNGLPDWNFMENYIKDLSETVFYTTEIPKDKIPKLEKSNFKEFNLSQLFSVRGSKKSFTKNDISSGDYLYITTSNKNNGVSGTSDIFTENGNIITIDSATEGKAFYQEEKFVGSDHVEVLEPINFSMNKYTGLFLTSVLNIETFRYSFGRKRSQKRILKEKLFLPVDKNGGPDFDFMEKYIRDLNYSSDL